MQDPYVYPGTHVLRNKFDVQDAHEFQRLEYDYTLVRQAQLVQKPVKGKYDLAHLQEIHKHIFQDVYEWAGKIRTITISKNGDLFARPEYIESYYAQEVAPKLLKEKYLRGIPDKAKFVERLAYYFGEINSLHPFREGNGRATQTLFSSLAGEAGCRLDFSKVDKVAWNEAAKESHRGRMGPIKEVFDKVASQV